MSFILIALPARAMAIALSSPSENGGLSFHGSINALISSWSDESVAIVAKIVG